jgi:uncharacterized protein
MSESGNLKKRLGVVVSGSVSKGIEVKLDPDVIVEDILVGNYVAISGNKSRFLGLITDIVLNSLEPASLIPAADTFNPLIRQVIQGTTMFGQLHVLTELKMGGDAESLLGGPKPAKTVPIHFSEVFTANQQDIEMVFGTEDEKHYYIGTPLDMDTRVCLDTHEFVKRSNGIFGKSGTGKTFLTRLLLIGMIQKHAAVNLIFDMHSEYGWEGQSEKDYKVKGLKQLFPSQIAVFTLDEESSRRRKVQTDYTIKIGYDEIEPEDIDLLRQTLNLTEAATQAVYQFARKYGDKHWLEAVLNLTEEESSDVIEQLNIHEGSYRNLRRGLENLRRFPFLVPKTTENSVKKVLEYLDRGMHVVLEFGRFDDYVAYILVANLLTRRIYNQYREKVEKAIGEDKAKPKQLVITIEEAHRFLNPELAAQTIFGKISREMRKYNVTLLVIDQRPSGIDDEVMSQLGTKVTCLLDNEKDIDSVLSGTTGKGEMKSVLSKLESKQQVLIFGHSVPAPIVVRIREYGSPKSYKEFGFIEKDALKKKSDHDINGL